ncbi:MAG TPA: HK97-gp10 family putative phage morphogenesis protein [Burkholderiales bacterium]|nr:HK97-gp10 family putative phage morphogenesis protein [Burkholderiales bacterium]
MLTVEVRGLRELRNALLALPRRIARPLLNRSLMVGGRLIRDEARARVPLLRVPDRRRVRGALRRAIHAGVARPQGHAASVWVRVRPLTRGQIAAFKRRAGAGAQNPLDPFYWRWLEFGTSKMAARPFLRPAFEAKKEQAARAIIADLRPRILAEAEKLGRRTMGGL